MPDLLRVGFLRLLDRPPPVWFNSGMEDHRLKPQAQAYLENVDRIKRKVKRSKGAEAYSDATWLDATDSILRGAFLRERLPGELFGDFLSRVSGSDLRAKSVPYRSEYPDLTPLV